MSNIATFKNGFKADNGQVRSSLVRAELHVVPYGPTMFTYADGRTCEHPDGEHHDCLYVDARNRLIPAAMRAAFATPLVEDPNGIKRSAAFLAEMTKLAISTGLTK